MTQGRVKQPPPRLHLLASASLGLHLPCLHLLPASIIPQRRPDRLARAAGSQLTGSVTTTGLTGSSQPLLEPLGPLSLSLIWEPGGCIFREQMGEVLIFY